MNLYKPLLSLRLREGFILKKVKKDGNFHVRAWPPPPYKMEKLFLIFLGIRPFFENTLKNSHFALENANFGVEISTKDLKSLDNFLL